MVCILYRENVLGGTKAVSRCILYHLKRFLVHRIVTRVHRVVINGTGVVMVKADGD